VARVPWFGHIGTVCVVTSEFPVVGGAEPGAGSRSVPNQPVPPRAVPTQPGPPPLGAPASIVGAGRPGDGWRTVAYVNWALVFAATTAVAVSSRTIGRAVWWLGPPSDPSPRLWLAVPIGLVVVPVFVVARRHPRAGLVGIVCSVGLAASALVDAGSTPVVAAACAVVAAASLIGNVAVWVGLRQYR